MSWIIHYIVHYFLSLPFCGAVYQYNWHSEQKWCQKIVHKHQTLTSKDSEWAEWWLMLEFLPPGNNTPYSFLPQWRVNGWTFSDAAMTPIKDVTIETGRRACDRPNSETARIVWNPIAVLASIYKVIHSFWQCLLSRRTPHFHDNQQNIQPERTKSHS